MSRGSDSLKSILYALGANTAIAAAKFLAAVFTGSGAMIAEAIHSLADTGNQLLLILGLRHAKSPPSPDYPLGFGKAIYFWSFIVAIILFSLGGIYSVYEGIHKLKHPEPLANPAIAISVLIFAIIAEGFSMWGCLNEIEKVRRGRSLWRWFRESRQSELLVVFGEDFAALLGLALASGAVTLAVVTGNPAFDAMGTIIIGVLLLLIAIAIGVEVQALLIGQSVEPYIRSEMVSFIEGQPEIEKLFNLLSMQLGNDVMVAIKAKMADAGSAEKMIEAVNACEARFRERFPQTLWLFFEPDVKDGDRNDRK